jgi:hypothetical protein
MYIKEVKKTPPHSIAVVVGPQPTQFLGKYESFMLSQEEKGII